jgi:two-component system cell cycle response regulator
VLDIDHFKKINDTHGHQGGDEVLRSFSKTLSGMLREGDVLFRYGGEEFVALLPHADQKGALSAADRLVKAIAAAPVQVGSASVRVTTSAGVASLAASDADGQSLVARADVALYEAKAKGRNRALAAGARLALVERVAS